jgi:succinate dehydrogenase/fumarate reductase-like Fe-S protein
MSYTLNARAFFFNAKTDYLPYYKNFKLSLEENATAKDMLIAIKEQNENFAFPELNLIFKVNGLMVEEDTPLSKIVEKLGTSLTIEPASSYRSNNGLIINNNDFMQSFELVAPYATEEDKNYYKTLYPLHYASESANFDRTYIGDAVLVLAHKMITEGNEHKTEILNAISSVDAGLFECEYENNLFTGGDHAEAITALKEMVKNDDDDHPSLLDMIKSAFGKEKEPTQPKEKPARAQKKIDDITEKQVAYYPGITPNTTVDDLIETHKIRKVSFSRENKLSGLSIFEESKALALKKAGATLLDAFDSSAQVLIIEENETYDMMQNNFKAIEKTVGREIIGLELISSEDFIKQLA